MIALKAASRFQHANGSLGRVGRRLLALVLGAQLLCQPAAAGPSGLPWQSGGRCEEAAFAAWRGRPLDAQLLFVQHDTWEMMRRALSNSSFREGVRRSPLPVVSLPMMPRSEKQQHARCARGDFDARFREFGQILSRIGAGRAIVRLGWEANVGSGSHPWGIDEAAEIPDYVRCFRREVEALKATAPNLRIEWTNAKASAWPFSVLDAYPGDAWVDLLGVHYYSVDDQFSTQEKWDAFYMSTRYGGPQGLGQWILTAKSMGMKLGIAEWGTWARFQPPAVGDAPKYISKMYRFFAANASTLAYETYFNCGPHRLHPNGSVPNAAFRYRDLW